MIGCGGEVSGEVSVSDGGGFAPTNRRDGECAGDIVYTIGSTTAIGEQIEPVVLHPTIGMNSTKVARANIPRGFQIGVRLAFKFGVLHIPEHPIRHPAVIGDEIVAIETWLTQWAWWIILHHCSENIGERFLQRPGFVAVSQIGFVIVNGMCPLVPDHVQGGERIRQSAIVAIINFDKIIGVIPESACAVTAYSGYHKCSSVVETVPTVCV